MSSEGRSTSSVKGRSSTTTLLGFGCWVHYWVCDLEHIFTPQTFMCLICEMGRLPYPRQRVIIQMH